MEDGKGGFQGEHTFYQKREACYREGAVYGPGWCRTASVAAPETVERRERDGYCYLTGAWHDGDAVALEFPMDVHIIAADSRVWEDIGKAAVTRGPITFCAEEADNGKDLHLYRLDTEERGAIQAAVESVHGFPVVTLSVPAVKESPAVVSGGLYHEYTPPVRSRTALKLIPYFACANRGEGEMRVWFRT